MKPQIVLPVVGILLASCGEPHHSPSLLQSFDALGGHIRAVTLDSTRVASDVRQLSRSMQLGDAAKVRIAAVRLKRDAGLLAQRSGRIGNSIRPLALREATGAARTYLSMGVWTMTWDWFEGRQLMQVADLAWEDPLLIQGTNASRMAQLSRVASWYAGMAVRSASRAAWWRWRYRYQLRYIPVSKPVPSAASTGG